MKKNFFKKGFIFDSIAFVVFSALAVLCACLMGWYLLDLAMNQPGTMYANDNIIMQIVEFIILISAASFAPVLCALMSWVNLKTI